MFKNVLEIGCLNGYSTYSFISALSSGAEFNLTLCDLNIQDSVRQMIKNHNSVNLQQKESIEVISEEFDFVFVDGSHDFDTVSKELSCLVKCNTKTILAHDTFIGHPNFKGAIFLRDSLSKNKKYHAFHHNELRKNDQTHYGISFFTQDKKIHNIARRLFARLNTKPKIFI
jgi:hypothetical protein